MFHPSSCRYLQLYIELVTDHLLIFSSPSSRSTMINQTDHVSICKLNKIVVSLMSIKPTYQNIDSICTYIYIYIYICPSLWPRRSLLQLHHVLFFVPGLAQFGNPSGFVTLLVSWGINWWKFLVEFAYEESKMKTKRFDQELFLGGLHQCQLQGNFNNQNKEIQAV